MTQLIKILFSVTSVVLINFAPRSAYGQAKVIGVTSELQKLVNISDLPSYVSGVVKQYSSYDTTGLNDDGFSGKYSYIRKNKDESLVIFEDNEAGVINRIWTPTPTNDTLDFYFDGSKDPSYSVKFADLFSGDVLPFKLPLCGNQVGGYFCYFPIPYKKSCKIVFRGKKLEFYQIQYRRLDRTKQIKTFDANLSSIEKQTLDQVSKSWSDLKTNVLNKSNASIINIDESVKPGETASVASLKTPGRIVGFEIENAKQFEGISKDIDLKITWDNEEQAAVYLPLADFFGYAYGKISMQSLLIGSANNVNYCYFPMPFDTGAKVELVYRNNKAIGNAEPLRVKGKIYYENHARNPKTEGKFYTFWNRDANETAGEPHVFLKGEGKGHYVGTVLQAQGLRPGMTLFFEGDDVTKIDGKMVIHGTGSEDYFNGGWYALLDRWDRKMSLPLHGSLDYSLPFSRTGGYRLFLSDKMPFEKSILHTIEHGPEKNNMPADYTSVAYYYADKAVDNGQIPSNQNTKIFLPDTLMLYPQLMSFSFNGEVKVSGERFTAKDGAQLRVDLQEIPSGKYKLYGNVDASPNGAEVTFWQRQTKVSDPYSFYSAKKEFKSQDFLCDLTINEFRNTVTLHFKSEAEKNTINFRRLMLVKVKD
ncbi:hypothetical protein ACVWYG_003263 [Pedobacter sp. UYEF25]